MANSKVPQLPVLSASTGDELLYIVDVHDTTDDPTGSSKQITRDNLLKNISGFTANTIYTESVIFNTGTTISSPVAGEVYYNSVEKSISYNTSINEDVTVNIGQQNYLRVFNNSGTEIPRGKALEVLSAYGGLPSVTLAINENTGFNVIGVSAEIIPNNSEGIVITNGIISDIQLTGMTVGSLVYASDAIPGDYVSNTLFLGFPLTARTNSVGYVVQTGTTTGKLFVNIVNENSALTLTDLERNVLEGNTLSTGLFEFTGMTTGSTTTINVAPLKGWLIKNTYGYATLPDVQSINYSGGTNISVTNISTADSTYILVNSGLTITQQVTYPTPQQRRENIYLGKINHPNRSTILNINNQADYDVSPMSSLRDLWSPIKLINDGIIPSPNGANLSFNTSAGTLWGNGINWYNNQLSPNNVNISAKVPATFNYRTQTGGTSTGVTVIDPTNYDVGGAITSIGNANLDDATNQRIYIYPTGVINVLYGQTIYSNLVEAVAAVQSESFIPYPNAAASGILIGILSVRNDIVADGEPLTNPEYAKFTFVSKFGESFGGTGGLSTTTLQQAYNNSTSPEIITNPTLGPLSIKNGNGADNVSNLFEGVNSGGTTTMFIRADGSISATTITATTISATTYQNLPTDVRVTGGTYSSSTGDATFTNNTGGTFNVSGFFKPSDDIYVTGGTYSNGNLTFTNKTGGTFSVLTSTNYAAGVISGATYTSTGTGQINLPAIKVALYNNANNIEPIIVYDVASGTTGSGGIPSLVDQDTNYIVVEYNGGTPRYYVYDNDGVVNDSSVVLFMIVYRLGNFVHTLEFGNQGAGLANKLNDRFIMTDRFGWESGLSLGLSGSTGVVTATEGAAWNASYRQSLTAVNSQDDVFFKNYHSGGVWTYTTTGDTLNNTYYDNGTNIVEATLDKYLVNWYFRGQEVNDHLYEVYGNDEYDSVAEAELSVEPLLPELITSHAFLLGRIIVLKSATTGVTQSAFVRVFQSTQVDNHEDLIGLQGGGPGEYYHLTSSQYNNIPYKNSGNTFTQGQVFTNGVTANTMNISSTPTTNDSPTEILTRDSTTGDVGVMSPQSPGLFNYGLANAIMTGNFLT